MKYRSLYHFLVIAGLISYLVSLFSPLLTVQKLYFFSDTITLLSILSTLMNNHETLLFIIVFIFTIILPSLKFILLIVYGITPHIEQTWNKLYLFLEYISKWAMLDVFIAALVVVIIKLGMFSSANTHYGLYLFTFSVLLSMFCSQTRHYWIPKK